VADLGAGTEAVLALCAETEEQVDALTEKALAAGGSPTGAAVDDGVMYSRGFRDLDGHLWEVIWITRAATEVDSADLAHIA
jgi:uncharacterized protein